MKNTYTRRRAAAAGAAVATMAAGFGLIAASAQTAQAWDINPASCKHVPHSHKHGVQPTETQTLCDRINAAGHAAASGPETLSYGGGIDGIGVQSGALQGLPGLLRHPVGHPEHGLPTATPTFSGDPDGGAPVAQQMFKGIGTGNELWSADLTQWCDGPNVSTGATSCPTQRQLRPLPERRRARRRLVRQRGGLPQRGDRPPAGPGGGQRGRALRQHHRGGQPRRLLRDPVPARHQPGQLPGPVLRLARLQR